MGGGGCVQELGEWRLRQQARIYESIVQRQRVFINATLHAPVLLLPEPGTPRRKKALVNVFRPVALQGLGSILGKHWRGAFACVQVRGRSACSSWTLAR